jgi:hypothetical protein
MAIAPDEGLTAAEARAATAAARKAAAARTAADEAARIAESDTRLRARIPSSPNYVAPETKSETTAKATTGGTTTGGTTTGTNKGGASTVDPSVQAYVDALNRQSQQLAEQQAADVAAAQRERVSAFNILKEQFDRYGLGSLVDGIKNLLTDGTPSSEFALRLRETPEYKARFKANEARIAAGLTALSPAEYVAMEDQYQNIMRNYGLPATYYTKDATGRQAGFEKFLANDVSASELEDRIATAQQRVLNTNPEVLQALKQFYPDISNADILAYTLDPQNALTNIKRKVTAAEIGGAALAQGLKASGGTAESLAGQGITKAQAQQGYADIANILPRGAQLADIYGEQPYTQATAEAEVFNTAGASEAARKRKKLTELEKAQFGGQSGVGALGRDKSLYGQSFGQSGQY